MHAPEHDDNPEDGLGKRSRRRAKPDSWTAVRGRLKHWQAPELLGLLHGLFVKCPMTRAAILGKVMGEDRPAEALEPLRRRIRSAINAGGYTNIRPDLPAARRVVMDYARASGDVPGTVDLMLTFVESAYALSADFGDLGGPYYDSMHAMLGRLAEALRRPGARPARAAAAESLRRMSTNCVLGYGIDGSLDEALAAAEAKD